MATLDTRTCFGSPARGSQPFQPCPLLCTVQNRPLPAGRWAASRTDDVAPLSAPLGLISHSMTRTGGTGEPKEPPAAGRGRRRGTASFIDVAPSLDAKSTAAPASQLELTSDSDSSSVLSSSSDFESDAERDFKASGHGQASGTQRRRRQLMTDATAAIGPTGRHNFTGLMRAAAAGNMEEVASVMLVVGQASFVAVTKRVVCAGLCMQVSKLLQQEAVVRGIDDVDDKGRTAMDWARIAGSKPCMKVSFSSVFAGHRHSECASACELLGHTCNRRSAL